MKEWKRREFLRTTLFGGLAARAHPLLAPEGAREPAAQPATSRSTPGTRPLLVASANGLRALERGMEILKKGGDTLDAVLAAVNVVEDDPNDDSVGYGGLPNEDGEVSSTPA